jgi:hypothetical protein
LGNELDFEGDPYEFIDDDEKDLKGWGLIASKIISHPDYKKFIENIKNEIIDRYEQKH